MPFETECPHQDCKYLITPGETADGTCPNCARPYREQPSPTNSEMAMRNMPAPGGDDMGGNPLREGILADTGWAPLNKRDESFASVQQPDFEVRHVVLPEGDLDPELEDAVDDVIEDPRKVKTAMDSDLSVKSVGAQEDDPEEVDQKEKTDGDNHEWQKDFSVDGIGGPNSPHGLGQDAQDRLRMNLPLVLFYAHSDKNGMDDPLLKGLHESIESQHPGYTDQKDDGALQELLQVFGIDSPTLAAKVRESEGGDKKESSRRQANLLGTLGGIAGGALGTLLGPEGTAVGAIAGRAAGSLIGSAAGNALGGAVGGGGGGGGAPTSVGPVADPNLQAAEQEQQQQPQFTANVPNPGSVPNPAQQFNPTDQQIGERTCPTCGGVIPAMGTTCPQCSTGAIQPGQPGMSGMTQQAPQVQQAFSPMQLHANYPPGGVLFDPPYPEEQALQGMTGEVGECPHCGRFSHIVDGHCLHCDKDVAAPPVELHHASTQGPVTPEQTSAVQQLLLDTGREQEVPNVPLHPEQYAGELAQIMRTEEPPVAEDNPQPVPDPSMMAPTMPGDQEQAQMPVPGMAVSKAMQGALERTAARKAFVHDHAQPEQLNHPETSAADAEHPFDPEAQQDTSHAWQDELGEQLEPGQQYRIFSDKYAIPDLVRITQVKPDSIEVEETGAYGLNFPHEITWEEAQTEGYTFERAEDAAQSGLQANPDAPGDESHLVDQRTPAGSGEQTDLSDSHAYRLLGKTAGADYSRTQQRDLIEERGTARNLDSLDLSYTHYSPLGVDDDSDLFF